MREQLPKFLFVLACFAALAVFPHMAGKFGVDLATKIMIFSVLALSLELLVGTTGLVCFGQAAFFGIGAYATVLLSPSDGPASLATLLPLCVLLAAAYALVVGALSLRTKGVYFIMVTLAFAQMAYYVVHDTPLGGGTDGQLRTRSHTAALLQEAHGLLECILLASSLKRATRYACLMHGSRPGFCLWHQAARLTRLPSAHVACVQVTLFTRGKTPIATQIPDDTPAGFAKYAAEVRHLKGNR
jgi:ABC-type branched-subunit amino acid transport system permease subunit